MFEFRFGEGVDITGPVGEEIGISEEPFEVSEDDDLGEALVDRERGGQEASMTGSTSIHPLDGLCQAGFFPWLAAVA